jgi:heat shock protein HtpX
MKRVVIFLLTNLAVMAVISIVVSVLGLNRFLTSNGLNLPMLLAYSAVVGFAGAFISLLLSKTMAKWSTGAQVIQQPRDATEQWLVATVRELSQKAGITMPEVAIYEGEPNAFATGAFKNSALVAVSTGLLASMTREEVEAVLAHEVAHVANGDMVTLTLVQGVVNTFVVFFARIVGYIVDRVILKNDREVGIGFYVASFVAEMLFGVLALIIVSWFSRRREFRADAGAAQYMGTPTPMANALARLGGLVPGALPKSFAASGISGVSAFGALFASHPPIEARIRALGGQITQGGAPANGNQAFGRSTPNATNGFGRSAR